MLLRLKLDNTFIMTPYRQCSSLEKSPTSPFLQTDRPRSDTLVFWNLALAEIHRPGTHEVRMLYGEICWQHAYIVYLGTE